MIVYDYMKVIIHAEDKYAIKTQCSSFLVYLYIKPDDGPMGPQRVPCC
jgi:hypothetical protein